MIFDQEVVLKPKRTVMCLYPEGGIDATELVDATNNEEVVVVVVFVVGGGVSWC